MGVSWIVTSDGEYFVADKRCGVVLMERRRIPSPRPQLFHQRRRILYGRHLLHKSARTPHAQRLPGVKGAH
jgi:hypothetical protein